MRLTLLPQIFQQITNIASGRTLLVKANKMPDPSVAFR
jgi:hypothetical protein